MNPLLKRLFWASSFALGICLSFQHEGFASGNRGLLARAARTTDLGLPRWFDPQLEKSDGLPPIIQSPFADSFQFDDFRVPAEFEPIESVILSWKSPTQLVGDISRAVIEETNASVIVADGPRRIGGIPTSRLVSVDCPVNSVWVRDYGPIGVHTSSQELGFVDAVYRHFGSRRDDDALPSCLANALNKQSLATDLVLDGGNFMIDSAGQLFTTRRTYEWNSELNTRQVDEKLRLAYGAKKIHVLDYAGESGFPKDGTGHIDMFIKLLSPEVVVISDATSEPFKSTFKKAVEYFESLKTSSGNNYRILRVPGWFSNGTWYTYTNSLVVNGVALVPSYKKYPRENAAARAIYEKAGLKVRMIPSDSSIVRGGSIHCVTQTIPAVAP